MTTPNSQITIKPDVVAVYFERLKSIFDSLDYQSIEEAINVLHRARMEGHQVFVFGNGGSAATAAHMVCDLMKNTQRQGWPPLKVYSLSDNVAMLSAYANDDGYENVFAIPLGNLMAPDDVVIAISTSGNSPNVLRGVEVAREHGAYTMGFTGFTGGQLSGMVDLNLHVPSDIIEHVEDIHLMLEHLITKTLREMRTDQE